MPWEKNFDIDQALERAMKIFWARGYQATSMQDLVDGMGVNRGSIYDTFADKRSLFIAALQRYDDVCRKSWLADLERNNSPYQAIQGLFEGWVGLVLADKRKNGCFLTNTALELAVHDQAVGNIVANSQKEIEKFFRRLIKLGQFQGEISTQIDAVETARSLLASLLGMLVLARSRPHRQLLCTVSENALRSLI